MVQPGDDLAALLGTALDANSVSLGDGDVLCLAQKIVSKAEGCQIALSTITPGAEAMRLADLTGKDSRVVQLILDESTEVLRHKPNVLIVRHKLGIVGAHAGIDQSNIEHDGDEYALLLPPDPDASAERLRAALAARYQCQIGVVITDSHNRPWRMGTIGCAIGCAGIKVLDDQRGGTDLFGRDLQATLINRADALASAATLVMGETTEGLPAVVLRGLPMAETLIEPSRDASATAQCINRPLAEDMFR